MSRVDRWAHLVACGDALDRAGDAELAALARRRLGSVLEVFGPDTDPVQDYEGAAVRRFAAAMQRALERLAAQ